MTMSTPGPRDTAASHRSASRRERGRFAVLTISDTRTVETDRGGRRILEALEGAGHQRVGYRIVPDDAEQIQEALSVWLEAGQIDLILTTGGTGMARRDTTIEVVDRLLEKPLQGFGELFRMLSYEEIGAAAMLSRATAGLAGETLLFALPGSPNAVRLALEKLILPELSHLLWERRR